MAELMMIIGLAMIGWFTYKLFEDAKEKAWEEGFEDGRQAGYAEGKVIGSVEATCDMINVNLGR